MDCLKGNGLQRKHLLQNAALFSPPPPPPIAAKPRLPWQQRPPVRAAKIVLERILVGSKRPLLGKINKQTHKQSGPFRGSWSELHQICLSTGLRNTVRVCLFPQVRYSLVINASISPVRRAGSKAGVTNQQESSPSVQLIGSFCVAVPETITQ